MTTCTICIGDIDTDWLAKRGPEPAALACAVTVSWNSWTVPMECFHAYGVANLWSVDVCRLAQNAKDSQECRYLLYKSDRFCMAIHGWICWWLWLVFVSFLLDVCFLNMNAGNSRKLHHVAHSINNRVGREKGQIEMAGMFQRQQFDVPCIKHCRWFESIMISWQNDF